MSLTLIIGSKNVSSWSLRGWLAMQLTGAEFEEVLIPLGGQDTARRIREQHPELKTVVTILDDEQREAVIRDVIKMAMDDVAIMPLFHLINTWATRRGLTYEPRMDERSWAMGVR